MTDRLSAIRCFPFLFLKHSPSYRQRKRSLGFARDDNTGNVLFPHILCMMHGIAIPHAVISSAAKNLFHPLFPDFFAKPFMGNTVPTFPAMRCFPFLAVKYAPSYRQRKRSLDFARDDDTRNAPFPLSAIRCFPFLAVRRSPSCRQRKRPLDSARDDDTGRTRFPHILCMMHGIAIPHTVISSAARNLFRPSFPSSFAKPFTGSTVHLSAIRCFPFLAVRRSPSYRQRKRSLGSASDDDTGNVLFPLSAIRCFRFLLSDMHHKQKSHEQNCSWLFHLHASWDYP